MRIPEKGLDKDTVLKRLEGFRSDDVDWRSGKTFGYIYDPGPEASEVAKTAYMMYLSENALDPTVFPSLSRFEAEVVAMGAAHVNGDEHVVGSFTTGGTESCMLGVKTARDRFREEKPEITRPEMILPVTAHAAFHKAAHYMDIQVVPVGVDGETFKADVAQVREAVTPNTVLIVASAPSYAHGVIDPIGEIGAIAQEHGLNFHVDACMGGFALPYFRRLGEDVPDFDFSVPGVTSLSMELHKYAYCPKGASLILYRNKDLRRHQIFACSKWTGYTIVNPTIGSTKPGGPVAAAWAVLHYLGDEGYLEMYRKKLECMKALTAGLREIPDLRILGTPEMTLVGVTSDTVNVFHLIDEMNLRGWYIQPQLQFAGSQANVHISVSMSNIPWVDAFLADLKECIEVARKVPASELPAMVESMFGKLEPQDLTPETFDSMLGMAGIQGTTLPKRMAEINEVLNALPVPMRERLVTEFINELFRHKEEAG